MKIPFRLIVSTFQCGNHCQIWILSRHSVTSHTWGWEQNQRLIVGLLITLWIGKVPNQGNSYLADLKAPPLANEVGWARAIPTRDWSADFELKTSIDHRALHSQLCDDRVPRTLSGSRVFGCRAPRMRGVCCSVLEATSSPNSRDSATDEKPQSCIPGSMNNQNSSITQYRCLTTKVQTLLNHLQRNSRYAGGSTVPNSPLEVLGREERATRRGETGENGPSRQSREYRRGAFPSVVDPAYWIRQPWQIEWKIYWKVHSGIAFVFHLQLSSPPGLISEPQRKI